jgi:hypothetical protein
MEVAKKTKALLKLQRTCKHQKLEQRSDGVVVCKRCLAEVGYPPEHFEGPDEPPDHDDREHEHE